MGIVRRGCAAVVVLGTMSVVLGSVLAHGLEPTADAVTRTNVESREMADMAWIQESNLLVVDAVPGRDRASPPPVKEDAAAETDVAARLAVLASQGRLTVRALRAWDQLPERFTQLALELYDHDIDLLSADQAAVEALVARVTDIPDLSDRAGDLADLAQLLASYTLSAPDPAPDGTAGSAQAIRAAEVLPPDGVPGWILVSTEERGSQNRDSRQNTFAFSLRPDGATDRAQVRQSAQGYSRQVSLAFDLSWDEPPRFAFPHDTWQGRINVTDSGSGVEYLSGSAPEIDPKSAGFAVGAQYRSGTRPIWDRGTAATGRFSPDNPDSTGNPLGEAEIRWPERGCPGDPFTVEIRVTGWSGRGTVIWAYEFHPNLLRSPIFIDQFVARQAASTESEDPVITKPAIIQDCPDCPKMVVIPAGTFVMGSPDSERGRKEQEGPRTTVTIPRAFAMARTPVTQAQWTALMDSARFSFPDCPDCPADNISHAEARQYLRRLSEKTGHEYRLPSSAEWEYACRAGTDHRYCGGNQIEDVAWYRCNSDSRTHPVAVKAGNAFGLHDMSGNVMEWTRDCFTTDYRQMPTDGSPLTEGSSCTRMVSRGGSWFSPEDDVRAAARSGEGMMGENGFRPVRILAEPDQTESDGGN